MAIGIGAAGCAFLGYAIYFDYKRRSAKDYKDVIRLKRSFQRQMHRGQQSANMPIDFNGMRHIFLQEVQLGEEKLFEGFVHEGINHFANAIVMCNKPEQVLKIFRRTLPEDHYTLLQSAVPSAKKRFARLLEYSIGLHN